MKNTLKYINTQSVHTMVKYSARENPKAPPGIEPGTPWSVGNDVATESSARTFFIYIFNELLVL
jgi:hypothetical protein